MSVRALRWSYSLRDLTGPEKAVLNCLAWHHNGKTGQCNPSSKTIAAETGFAVGTVNKCLVSLAQKGLIDEVSDPQLGRVYTLAIVEPEPLPQSSQPAPTEQPYKKGNLEPTRTGARAPNLDSGFWKKWKTAPAAPPTPAAAVFVEEGSPQWRAHVAAAGRGLAANSMRDGKVGRWFRTEWPEGVMV